MIDAADAVVVGSGAFGSSVAYHLARHGLQVALLDRSLLASQTSPRAAGLTSQVRATPALTAIARRAVVKLASFTAETGQPLRFTQSGALKIARNERDAAQLGREVERGREAGIAIDFVSTAEARRRLPILRERGIVAVTWSPPSFRSAIAARPRRSARSCSLTRRPSASRSAPAAWRACARRTERSPP